ncbi:MAG: hypothetical protein QOJ46_2351 [bacterium]
MIVVLHGASGAVELVDPDDFGALAVRVDAGVDEDRLAPALEGIGTIEGSHVDLEDGALARLAPERAADPEWTASLERMLEYARSKGWADADGRVRAHIEQEG